MESIPINQILLSLHKYFPDSSCGPIAPILRALICAIARHNAVPVGQWLDLHLRALILLALPSDARDAALHHELLLGPNRELPPAGELPDWLQDYAVEGVEPNACDVPSDNAFKAAARVLREHIEAAVKCGFGDPLDNPGAIKPLIADDAPHRHRLFDPQKLQSAAASTIKLRDADRNLWQEKLSASGPNRQITLVTPAMTRAVEDLLIDAPNMREATLFVLGQLAVARRGKKHLAMPPLLLTGPPAAGKTWWAERIAAALGVGCEFIDMPGVSAAFELSGCSSSWNQARPGRIVRGFMATPSASPVFVLDEIDKIAAGNYPAEPVLLGLIERATATHFRDEFFDIDFDVSRSIFIATANRPERMDSALRSRFREIIVRAPTRDERTPIIASLWRIFCRDHSDLRLPKRLDSESMAIVVSKYDNARQTQRLFDEALGRAAVRRGRLRLSVGDFGGPAVRLVQSRHIEEVRL